MKISTCIPVYNGALGLAAALESLKNQTRKPDEVIVVDDQSKDQSLKIVEEFAKDLPIKIVRNEKNLGMIKNWNACLERASGDMVTFLHQDDGYLPGFLEEAQKVFNQNPQLGLWSCLDTMKEGLGRADAIGNGRVLTWDQTTLIEMFYLMKNVPPPTRTVFRRKALEEVGFYNPQYRYVAEPDLYLRIILKGYAYKQLQKVLVWRTIPDTRATARFMGTPVYYRDWFHFIKDWHQHELLKNSSELHQKVMGIVIQFAGWYIQKSLFKRDFKKASEIYRVVEEGVSEFKSTIPISKVTIMLHLTRGFLLGVVKDTEILAKKIARKLIGKGKKIKAQALPYKKAGNQFKEDFYRVFHSGAADPQGCREFLQRHSFYDVWAYYLSGPHSQMPWSGKKMSKLPMDYWIYRDVIESSRPRWIIEIGTCSGASALMLAELGRKVGANVVTVDIHPPPQNVLEEFGQQGIRFVLGDATNAMIAQEIISIVGNHSCMVIDDGSHLKEHVVKSFELLSSLVPKGGYYIVEDGFSNWLMDEMSHDALGGVEEILGKSSQWKRYNGYDQFIFFTAFQGVLKRV